MKRPGKRAGFTLVEMLLATTISIMVFAAMGILLTRCFSLWQDATAHWRLAQYARISRERILSGGFTDPRGGLLAATNAVIASATGWNNIEYGTAAAAGVVQQIRGWGGSADDKDILLKSGSSGWVYGQSAGADVPAVKVDSFAASITSNLVLISYQLRFSAAGKTFTQPHAIRACLINKE